MGTETEFGVSTPGHAGVNHMVASSQVVNGYAGYVPDGATRDRRTRWDFEEENPLRDARGFEVGNALSDTLPADPDTLTRIIGGPDGNGPDAHHTGELDHDLNPRFHEERD